jgi:hypothetical protein
MSWGVSQYSRLILTKNWKLCISHSADNFDYKFMSRCLWMRSAILTPILTLTADPNSWTARHESISIILCQISADNNGLHKWDKICQIWPLCGSANKEILCCPSMILITGVYHCRLLFMILSKECWCHNSKLIYAHVTFVLTKLLTA